MTTQKKAVKIPKPKCPNKHDLNFDTQYMQYELLSACGYMSCICNCELCKWTRKEIQKNANRQKEAQNKHGGYE